MQLRHLSPSAAERPPRQAEVGSAWRPVGAVRAGARGGVMEAVWAPGEELRVGAVVDAEQWGRLEGDGA